MQESPQHDHSKMVGWFEAAEDATVDSRKLAERDADYYDGKQITTGELAKLRRRRQPPVVNNRIKPKIDYMLGQELKTRTDPKAFPRNLKIDEDAANAATDALRYLCDATKFERVRSLCYEDGLKYGSYGGQIVVTPKGKEFDITFNHIPWDRMFFDPHSRAKDFSDCKYKGVVIWQDREDAEEMFPGKEDVISSTLGSISGSDTFDDKPLDRWADLGRDRVRVVYMEYLKGGEWHFCYFTKSGFLRDPEKMPFVNDDGETVPSLEFQSLFVDRDGNRYGQIRQYIDLQDEINKRHSKGLHLLNSRQTIGEKGAVDDVNKARNELAKPDGYIEVNPGMKFDIVPTNDMAAGNFQMMQDAKQEIDAQGPNASMVGAEKRDLSGRAIQALQAGSNTETSIQVDGLRDWEHRVYRLMWYCVKKYWTAEKWFRVTDDENAPKYVGLNTPSTAGEQLIKKLQAQGEEIPPEEIQMIMADPRAQQPVITNNVAEMDVDIILDDVPDTIVIQQEQFEQLTQLYPAIPDNIKPLAFEMLVQASSLRNKQQIIDKLQGKGEKPQQPDPRQEAMFALQTEKILAEIMKLRTEGIKNIATAEAAEVGTQIQEYTAQTQALVPQGQGQQPPQMPEQEEMGTPERMGDPLGGMRMQP